MKLCVLSLLTAGALLATTGCEQNTAPKSPEKAVMTLIASVDGIVETRTTTAVIKGVRATSSAFTQTALEFEPEACGPITIAGVTELEVGKPKPVALSRSGAYIFESTADPCIFKKMKIFTANAGQVTATLTILPAN